MSGENTLAPETIERVDEIVDLRFDGDTAQRDAAVNRALDVYEPFTTEDVNVVLKEVAKVLVAQGEIEEATEANVVSYAIRGMLSKYVSALHAGTNEDR